EDYYASDLISDLLSNGKSSMFNKNLIKGDKLFSQLDAYIQGAVFPGLFMINGKLYPETNFELAETKIKAQLNRIIKGEFSERELQKVKNRAISAMLFARVHHLNIAMELAYLEALGDAEMINEIQDKYQQVTHEKVVEVATKIFRDKNLSCSYYKSKNKNND
ncbi:MAG: insulinase family protein, partial [Bacteroidales bacterium]|nr:insulinase family protein [Bacteroidales bacterium]